MTQAGPPEDDRFALWRAFPATSALAALWVAVYALMLLSRNTALAPGGGLVGPGGIDTATAWRFGDATAQAVWGEGQLWRAETAAFIHFSLLHIGMNLVALVQLGRMVESMYGPGPTLLIASLIAFIANVAASYGRIAFNDSPDTHFGGGSSVIMGLVGLLAIVGWRSGTAVGRYIARQMFAATAFIVILGIALPVVDNYGHACGALAGVLIGLFHRRLLRLSDGPLGRRCGVVAVASFVLAASLQYRGSSQPIPRPVELEARQDPSLNRPRQFNGLQLALVLYLNYAEQASRPTPVIVPNEALPPLSLLKLRRPPSRKFPKRILREILRSTLAEWDDHLGNLRAPRPRPDADYDLAKQLLGRAISKPPTLEEAREFRTAIDRLAARTGIIPTPPARPVRKATERPLRQIPKIQE
ncbi:rhomboid family intramembrane serine protease [Isosphaeraceae bacterium EP7]